MIVSIRTPDVARSTLSKCVLPLSVVHFVIPLYKAGSHCNGEDIDSAQNVPINEVMIEQAMLISVPHVLLRKSTVSNSLLPCTG